MRLKLVNLQNEKKKCVFITVRAESSAEDKMQMCTCSGLISAMALIVINVNDAGQSLLTRPI